VSFDWLNTHRTKSSEPTIQGRFNIIRSAQIMRRAERDSRRVAQNRKKERGPACTRDDALA
jgi:hypothetical protein